MTFNRGKARHWSAGVALSTALATSLAAMPGQAEPARVVLAQAEQRSFDIPAQGMGDALALFGRQAGWQVSASSEAVRDIRSAGVSGMLAPEVALKRLLAGTGLQYRLEQGVAVVFAASVESGSATLLAPVLVEAHAPLDEFAGAADRANSILIGPEDLERRNPTTLKQVFAGEASVSVGGGQSMAQKVYVQGVEETNLAVSIDGARQNNKVFHHNGTNIIDPELLKVARVEPGVAAADAGPGALGGAIVYETVDVGDLLEPDRNIGGFTSTEFSTNGNTVVYSGSAYARHEGFEMLGFYKNADGGNYSDGNGTTVQGTAAGLQSGLAKLGYESQTGYRFEVSGEQVHDKAIRPFRANIGRLTNRNEQPRLYDMKRQNFAFNFSTPDATGMWDPKIVLGYGQTEVRVPTPFGSIGETGSLSGKLENTFNFSRNDTLSVGTDFYNDRATYRDPSSDMHEQAWNVGLFAQARIVPVDSLRLSFGARGDQQSFDGINGRKIDHNGLSGNASAAYDATDWLTVKAGHSRVFGGVALAENFVMNQNWNYNAGIEPVRSENSTAGFETHFQGFTFGAGIFRSEFDNARNETNAGGPSLTSDFETRGYNLSAGYNWGLGFARLTYTDTDLRIDSKPGDSDVGQYLGTPIGRLFALEVAHSFPSSGVSVGGTVDVALGNDDQEESNQMALNSYKVFNLYAEYQPEELEFLTLRVEGNNIFDEVYADRATYGQEFGNVIPLREAGRSFLVKAKAKF